ncbi:hypothetical protein B0H14DRAFT_2574925 [Mycena olivaceomarginata]|nr:hypothetical protein B0H14DRAFT_2574925 [Mycena olivaceomarginata]
MSTPTDPPTSRKKTASVPGATKLRAPTVLRANEPIAVETPQIIEEGTPAVTLASDDAASVQDSLPGLQTVSNSSDSNVTSSVEAEGGSPLGDVEVEAAVPPSVVPEASSPPKNGVETRVADTPVSAVRIADERTSPESVVGTEPGTTPTPS